MGVFFERNDNNKKLVLNYENKLTKLSYKYKAEDGQNRDYTDFSVVFPSSLCNFLCPNGESDIYFYKANNGQIHITGSNPGSMYEYEKVNVVERSDNNFGIVLPKYLYTNLSNYHKFKYTFNPDMVDFITGKKGVITAEPVKKISGD